MGAALTFLSGQFSRRPFFGLTHAIGLALDDADLGVMDEPVDDRDDTGGIGEDLAPFGEGAIGGDDRGLALVAAVDDLKQQIGIVLSRSLIRKPWFVSSRILSFRSR